MICDIKKGATSKNCNWDTGTLVPVSHLFFLTHCLANIQDTQLMVPNCVCINLSHPHEEEIVKKWYFIMMIWAFDQVYKKCQKRDFSIFDLIFENLPINLDGAMIPQKKLQTFLYQNIPQPAQ